MADKKFLKIDTNLTNTQRSIIAGILAALVIIGSLVGYAYFANQDNETTDVVEDDVLAEIEALSRSASGRLSSIEPEDLLLDTITFSELDIYPSAWVERRFPASNVNNLSITGATQDPDQDGLINKLEFIYGSDPLNPDSLCDGDTTKDGCEGRNDKENVDAGISPLTGLPITEDESFEINFQNQALIETLSESFDEAAREGLDFPTLYDLSRTVDNTEYVSQIPVSTVPETRENLLEYNRFKAELTRSFVGGDELESLTRVYSLIDLEELQNQLVALEDQYQEVLNYQVPDTQVERHQLFTYIYEQLVVLLETRIDGLEQDIIGTPAYGDLARQTSVNIVWSYRVLNELN